MMNRTLLQRVRKKSIGFMTHSITTDITQSPIVKTPTTPQILSNPHFKGRILTRPTQILTIATLAILTLSSNQLTLRLGMSM